MKNPSIPFAALMLTTLLAGAVHAQAGTIPAPLGLPPGRVVDDGNSCLFIPDQPVGNPVGTSALLDIGVQQTSQSGANVPQPPKNFMDPASEGWTPIKEADGGTSYAKTENGAYQYWKGTPFIVVKYDAKTCATECPASMKQYADKQQAEPEADKTMSTLNAEPPETPQDTSGDADTAGFTLGAQLGGNKDLFAANQDKTARIEVPVSGTPFSYTHAVHASKQVEASALRVGDASAASRVFDGSKAGERGALDEKAPQRLKIESNSR